MSTSTIATHTGCPASAQHVSPRSVWRHGVAAAAAGGALATAAATVAHSLGVSFIDQTGKAIPLAGLAQVAIILSLAAVALAATLQRRARRPQATFTHSALALLGLSLIAPWTAGFDAASALTLMALHVLVGAVVITTLRPRLDQQR